MWSDCWGLADMIVRTETGKPYPKGFLRDQARGKPCMVRIANLCGAGGCASTETTVLAHIGMKGLGGMGTKTPDLLGAWACDTCHGILDGRYKVPLALNIKYADLALWHHEGVARTIAALIAEGVLQYEL